MKKKIITILTSLLLLVLLTVFGFTASAAATLPEEGTDIASICLKDGWEIYIDANDVGETNEWYNGFSGEPIIESIPFETSKYGDVGVMWFAKTFDAAPLKISDGERVVIDFEGIQYYTKVWLNGSLLGEHEGANGVFSFDATDYIKADGENLLAIRCYSPVAGDVFNGIPSASLPTSLLGSTQHVQTPIYVKAVPQVSMKDIYVTPDYATGKVNVEFTLNNPANDTVETGLYADIKSANSTFVTDSEQKIVKAEPGESKVSLELEVANFIPWSPDNPYLYDVSAEVSANGLSEKKVVSTGFKEFYLDDEGYFVLNGERIFLKCVHTENWVVNSVDVGADLETQLHQLEYFKSAGYNAVRFLSGPAIPEMLDYCDRIGLLVYEETNMSWQQTDCEQTPELFQREVSQLLYRDRNHVSFTIAGLLNETYNNSSTSIRYETAVNSLELVRSIDNEVFVLLSSARWDSDNTIASGCNPGSTVWDAYMGEEGVEDDQVTSKDFVSTFGGTGDIHFYPYLPYNYETHDMLKTITPTRAAFISEGGAGSQPNIVADYGLYQQEGKSAAAYIGEQISTLKQVMAEYGIDSVYPTAEDIIWDTQKLQAEQRSLIFDYIRSNPNISGYSMTQGADVGYRGEGVLEGAMTHKEGMFDMLKKGWGDLRFNINIRECNIYSDEPLELDITLTNINTLEDKEYTALVTITGNGEVVFEKEVPVKANGTFVSEVLTENVDINDLSTGKYTVSAVLYGENIAETKDFWATQRSELPDISGTVVYEYDLNDELVNMLKESGVTVKEMDKENIPENAIILIGHGNTSSKVLEPLFESVEKTGSHVIGIGWDVFGEYGKIGLPFDKSGVVGNPPNWLYHTDSVIFETDITSGLLNNGLVDQYYYESVYDAHYYVDIQTPDIVHSVALFTGNDGGAQGESLRYGLTCGTYNHGKGTITVNTFDLEGGAGTPVADRMLINMINYVN